jgi:DNA-binding NtrC family response regulator
MVARGEFREDLLYRLKVIGLGLPALRERSDDILLLATRFMRYFIERHGLPNKTLSGEVSDVLRRYPWPGNIRELRNCIEGALVLSEDGLVRLHDLPQYILEAVNRPSHQPASASTLWKDVNIQTDVPFMEARELVLSDFDRAYLTEALRLHGGNVAQTAKAIGVHRQSLQKLMARRNIRSSSLGRSGYN